jgi:S-adenosyl-L-methionine hydrolase (adenosine-forming)
VADTLITLTTDFGYESPYVAAMKGVILSMNPLVRLIDLSHAIPPQDVRYAAFFLSGAIPYYPEDTLHVIVVDPGVGSGRALLYVEIGGQRLLVPDNGVWTTLVGRGLKPHRVIQLQERRYWQPSVSRTFHGRDIFAPVAAHLSLGLDPAALGPTVHDWVTFSFPLPKREGNRLVGEVVFVDHFGNLLTNLPSEAVPLDARVLIAGKQAQRVHAYADVPSGTLVALPSSWDTLEVAVTNENAAASLQVGIGEPVLVSPGDR